MKRDDFDTDLVKQYFGDVSPSIDMRRLYVKDGYMAKLPGLFLDNDPIDIIEWDAEYGDTVEFTSAAGHTVKVDVWDSFELVVYEVTERIRFNKAEG